MRELARARRAKRNAYRLPDLVLLAVSADSVDFHHMVQNVELVDQFKRKFIRAPDILNIG